MSGTITRLLLLPCALLGISQCLAWDRDWTVVTLARDGSWGVASGSSQSQAISEAIRSCREMAGAAHDCGAKLMAARGAWLVANLCGDHKVIATGGTLSDAEEEALNREISLQLFYAPDLPPCKRVVTVDPSGSIISSHRQYSTGR